MPHHRHSPRHAGWKQFVWALLSMVYVTTSTGCGTRIPLLDPNVEVVEVTDRKDPPVIDDGLTDDQLGDKVTTFDPTLVDRRPLGDWQINLSEAVVKLDVPVVQPDYEGNLLVLHRSYQAALTAINDDRVLPSVNLIDGKAKQFDDGLYAAIDMAYFEGVGEKLPGHRDLVARLLAKVGDDSPAAPYLAAGLTLGGRETQVPAAAVRDQWIAEFRKNPALAKPLGYYTWNDSLRQCWAMLRFLQQSLNPEHPQQRPILQAMAAALADDPALATEYRHATEFYGKLTNPLSRLSCADVIGVDLTSRAALDELRQNKGITDLGISFFPPSTTRETELFNRLFPTGVPSNANLMKELVLAIRSGKVDLTPRPESGWYDHQVYALQTMLLPELGEEHQKLMLTKRYKKRMLEAFAALITKRRETHIRQAGANAPTSAAPEPLDHIPPRLRLEPCPSYYLRTARSYAFVENLLHATLGAELLQQVHGLRASGPRAANLAQEIAEQRQRFYGFYLLSCEDIGYRPELRDGELEDLEACYQAAESWLGSLASDPDLAEDTRVAVPIFFDTAHGKMRLWTTLGVRWTKLEARYAKPPRVKPANGEGEWQLAEPYKLKPANYLIAVDEFAEVEVPTLEPPNREQLRRICDQFRTKDEMIKALSPGRW